MHAGLALKRKAIGILTALCVVLAGCSFDIRTPSVSVPRGRKPNLFRGVFHVHTHFSHDSKASLDRVLRTARRAGLDFVVVTDHNTLAGRQAYQKMGGLGPPVLIFGNEISTSAGHLVALGIPEDPPQLPLQELIDWIHRAGGYAVVAHPFSRRKPWVDWSLTGFDGIEIFSFPDVYYVQDVKTLIPKSVFLAPRQFLKSVLKTPRESLALWNERLRSGRVSAFGAVDAHLRWEWLGFAPENFLLYFQAVTMYVTADRFEERELLRALIGGASFIAFEARGVAADFVFQASYGDQTFGLGDTVTGGKKVVFSIEVPESGEMRLIHDGTVLAAARGKRFTREADLPGAYRAEVYRDGELWIVSNPIYLLK